MNELFFHECRAAGLVFKTSDDWFMWLTDNGYDIKKPVQSMKASSTPSRISASIRT